MTPEPRSSIKGYPRSPRAVRALLWAARARRRALLESRHPGCTGESVTHHLATAHAWLATARATGRERRTP